MCVCVCVFFFVCLFCPPILVFTTRQTRLDKDFKSLYCGGVVALLAAGSLENSHGGLHRPKIIHLKLSLVGPIFEDNLIQLIFDGPSILLLFFAWKTTTHHFITKF